MTYRVTCSLDIAFQSKTEAIKLFKTIKQTIGTSQGLDVKAETNSVHLEVHKCYHGDLAPRSCVMIEVIDSLPVGEA